jgi:hypothetical protein
MKCAAALMLLSMLGCFAVAYAAGNKEPSQVDLEHSATGFVDLLVAGEFAKAVERFDATMKEAWPGPKLREVWNTIQAQARAPGGDWAGVIGLGAGSGS